MNRAIGFSLAYKKKPPRPKWLATYPWLHEWEKDYDGWAVRAWGHGDLGLFAEGNRILIGYSDKDTVEPLHNRSVVIHLDKDATIENDFAGYLPVFYGNGMASTDEGCIETARTLDPARATSFLLFNSLVAGTTLWREIDWLYGNSKLTITRDGHCSVEKQEPLSISPSLAWQMPDVLERTVRCYTDPLDEVYLTVSSGYDSRLIMVNMDRPERIRARTYPIARPVERNGEFAIARASAQSVGLLEHKMVSAWHYGPYLPQIMDYFGPTISPLNGYILAFLIRANRARQLPFLHGVGGDTLSGNPVEHNISKVAWRWDEAGRFEQLCRTDPHAWKLEELDRLLTFDWREALASLRPLWAQRWRESEGHTISQRADLARLRNRTAMLILRSFSILDVYGGMISVYCDREYTEYMLGLPDEARLDRSAQKAMARKKWPDMFPLPRPLSASAWDSTNTIDQDNISEAAMWPTENLDHPMFRKPYVDELRKKALDGDLRAFWLLFPLQTIAYGVGR